MHFSTLALLAFSGAGFVVAQTPGFDPISSPGNHAEVPTESSFTIEWTSTQDGKITITLLQGPSSTLLQKGEIIANGIENSLESYAWDTPSEAKFDTYGLMISLDSDPSIFQYSFPFTLNQLSPGNGTSSSTSSMWPTTSSATMTKSKTSTNPMSTSTTQDHHGSSSLSMTATSNSTSMPAAATSAANSTAMITVSSSVAISATSSAPASAITTGAASKFASIDGLALSGVVFSMLMVAIY